MNALSFPMESSTPARDKSKKSVGFRETIFLQELPPTPEPMQKPRRWRAIKNVAVLCIAFLLHSCAHGGTVGMQSSVNAAMSAGTAALAVASTTAWAAGCCVAAFENLRKIASGKWALAASLWAAAPYTVATTIFPDAETLLPAAALQGVATVLLWASQGAYLAAWESELGKGKAERASFTMFFLAVHLGDVIGNLFFSSVLSFDHPRTNSSLTTNIECGFSFCWPPDDNSNFHLQRPSQKLLSEVGFTFLACVLFAGALVATLLDPVKRVDVEDEVEPRVSSPEECRSQVTLFRQMTYPYQILLVPLTLFAGMEEAFLHTDYTQAYAACAIGISNLGYVMACYAVASGVGAIVSCVASGYFAEGRASLLVIGATLHGGLLIVLIVWTPHSLHPHSLFVVASLWGLCDALWKTQISVIYEAFFPNDPTMALVVLWLWESAGYALGCGLSVPLCTGVKLHTLLAVLFAGLAGYAVVESCAAGCQNGKKNCATNGPKISHLKSKGGKRSEKTKKGKV